MHPSSGMALLLGTLTVSAKQCDQLCTTGQRSAKSGGDDTHVSCPGFYTLFGFRKEN